MIGCHHNVTCTREKNGSNTMSFVIVRTWVGEARRCKTETTGGHAELLDYMV